MSRLAVLDIETVASADAVSLTVRGTSGRGRGALHEIVSASVLTAEETDDGFADVDVRTFTALDHQEGAILSFVDYLLPDPAERGARLVTYNGGDADLRLLKLRAASLWAFDLRRVAGWTGEPSGTHVDLIREGWGSAGFRWSLPDLCAGLGFAVRPGRLARSIDRLVGEGCWDVVAEHNMMDVVGTFLAYAHLRSMQDGTPGFAASAWTGMARMLDGTRSVNVGLQRLADHHLVEVARGRIAEKGRDAEILGTPAVRRGV